VKVTGWFTEDGDPGKEEATASDSDAGLTVWVTVPVLVK
jgi:hypothetical protein